MSGVQKFPRGSEWRKWDLHVHTPGTKMNDGYELSELSQEENDRANELYEKCENSLGNIHIDKQCAKKWLFWIDTIHNSGVRVVGVTDYFSLENFFLASKVYGVYKSVEGISESESVVFFPNMEFRTEDRMNKDKKRYNYVNAHILFTPEITVDDWEKLKNNLQVTVSEPTKIRGTSTLADIKDSASAETATISRVNIVKSLKHLFGDNYRESCAIVISGKKDGISLGSGERSPRVDSIFDEYADMLDGIFSMSAGDVQYWLNPEDHRGAKPCFGGSDAHNFGDLKKKLGKQGEDGHCSWKTTWIKADPTFEGFLQVFIEPEERVKIQADEPDSKNNFAWIKEVLFNHEKFPKRLLLNKNLNSVIGSRSSGKSALLGYIALANGLENINIAPGISIEEARMMNCSIKWADGIEQSCSSDEINRKVVYIPQNKLFNISSDPEQVTNLIRDSISEENRQVMQDMESYEEAYRDEISSKLDDYFKLERSIHALINQQEGYGDIKDLRDTYKDLSEELSDLQTGIGIKDDEKRKINELNKEISWVDSEILKYEGYTSPDSKIIFMEEVFDKSVNIQGEYNPEAMEEVREYMNTLKGDIVNFVENINSTYRNNNLNKVTRLRHEKSNKENELGPLNEKLSQSKQIQQKIEKCNNLNREIESFENIENEINNLRNQQSQILIDISSMQKSGSEFIKPDEWKIGDASVSLVIGYPRDYYEKIERYVNQKSVSKVNKYLSRDWELNAVEGEYNNSMDSQIDVKRLSEVISQDIVEFIESQGADSNGGVVTLKGKPNKSNETLLQTFIKLILCDPREVRLKAKYEGDEIGGFKESNMTPGKQALFALELILSQTNSQTKHRWPLLIDQPEDDLDSRSIYKSIVPKIREIKKERQIIMVSHDANMVVGSDSEEVIVVNRDGGDQKNEDGKYFNYLSGSLENTMMFNHKMNDTLKSQGIREHCCVILDGGEEAFAKRKSKYNI